MSALCWNIWPLVIGRRDGHASKNILEVSLYTARRCQPRSSTVAPRRGGDACATASEYLVELFRIDDDGHPEKNIKYNRHGALPRTKVWFQVEIEYDYNIVATLATIGSVAAPVEAFLSLHVGSTNLRA